MTTQKNPRNGSPARFNSRAKIVTGAAAMVAMLGGWNAIGHLENSAQAAPADSAAPASLPAALPRVEQRVQTGATLDSLGIAPMKALPALPHVLAEGAPAAAVVTGSQTDVALQLPALPTLQALPELPALPSQPPPPPAASSTRSGGS
jgi:hypothetical protein